MTTRTYELKLPYRTATLTTEEHPDRIVLRLDWRATIDADPASGRPFSVTKEPLDER